MYGKALGREVREQHESVRAQRCRDVLPERDLVRVARGERDVAVARVAKRAQNPHDRYAHHCALILLEPVRRKFEEHRSERRARCDVRVLDERIQRRFARQPLACIEHLDGGAHDGRLVGRGAEDGEARGGSVWAFLRRHARSMRYVFSGRPSRAPTAAAWLEAVPRWAAKGRHLYCWARTGVAQLEEQRSPKPPVGGSSPSTRATVLNLRPARKAGHVVLRRPG